MVVLKRSNNGLVQNCNTSKKDCYLATTSRSILSGVKNALCDLLLEKAAVVAMKQDYEENLDKKMLCIEKIHRDESRDDLF